jgi:hypothetical protein
MLHDACCSVASRRAIPADAISFVDDEHGKTRLSQCARDDRAAEAGSDDAIAIHAASPKVRNASR